jgi:hypothetical protein
VFVEGGLYHVSNRFARGESVFADPEEAIEFVELLREVKDPLADVAQALIGFGETLKQARRQYSARVRAGVDEGGLDASPGRLSEVFQRDRRLDAPQAVFVDELGRSTGLERPALDGARYLREACAILEVEPERLASGRRDRETAALRKLVAAAGIERWGQRAGELARLLGKHTVAVSRWVSDAARERQTNSAYEKKLLWLDERLSERALAAQARGELVQVTLEEQ